MDEDEEMAELRAQEARRVRDEAVSGLNGAKPAAIESAWITTRYGPLRTGRPRLVAALVG